jgi:hypothetical protein
VRVVADLLPKEANINVDAGEAFVKLWGKISDGLGEEFADSLDAERKEPAPEALQGFHAEHLLFLIDEASGIPRHRLRGWHGRSVHTRRKGRYGG